MERFFQLQNHKDVFERHANAGKISEQSFISAMLELGSASELEDSLRLFKEADIDDDGYLDLEEFCRVISTPSKLEQWCNTLALGKLMSCCLHSADDSIAAAPDPLRIVSRLDQQTFSTIVDAFCEGAKCLLSQHAKRLSLCYSALDRKAAENADGSGSNAKFQTVAMNAGKADDFHRGMTDRVGESPVFSCV